MEQSGMIPKAQALPGGGDIGTSFARAAGAQSWGYSFAPKTELRRDNSAFVMTTARQAMTTRPGTFEEKGGG